MAVYHGKNAKVAKNGVQIVNITEWMIEFFHETYEVPNWGNRPRMNKTGKISWGGTFGGYLDPENTEQAALFTAHLGRTLVTDCAFYLDSSLYFTGDIWITGVGRSTNVNDVGKITFTFIGNGEPGVGTYKYGWFAPGHFEEGWFGEAV